MTYIDSHEFAVHAQEFVEATSALVSGRTINIMNTDGIIIASTERERIGDFHQGAKEVAETGKPVRIGKADLYRYPGAREGYNLPIISAGRIIGVVGMYGEEAEISDAANLLCVYVTQYFEQQTRTHQRELEYEIRERLLELYLLGDKNQAETIFQLEDAISIHLRYPAEVVIIRSKEAEGIARSGNARPESIYEILRSERENGRKDIFGIKGNDLIVLHALRGQDREKDPFYAALRQRMLTERSVRISISSSCHKLEDIPEGFTEAMELLRIDKGQFCEMYAAEDRCSYYMSRLIKHGGGRFTEEQYRKLAQAMDSRQLQLLLETAAMYYHCNHSVQEAAALLHIHKNTLQYRMNHLYELLELDNDDTFERELFIRMLIVWHRDKHNHN
ncbi:CdaR family transcriptional regulator [Oribacterium sp. HCP28S3_H8]|uniref:CdaR family transcriptional regulator n=1 Tax=Oribacterium sp. HCP28S3_H8 TaxID=3438945 RepID=UPI003F8C4723